MNITIERFLLPLFFIMSIIYAFNSCAQPVQLQRVFHHRTQSVPHVERGSLSLYFSHKPIIEKVEPTETNAHRVQYSFFFPEVTIKSPECDSMITRINNEMGNTYSVKIEYSLQPDPGVRIVFHYDPQSCALQYEHIDTSTVEAGCIFRIYNREFLQQLQENSNPPLLRTLLHTERPTVIIDPGHGGIDTGTIGVNGTIEKNICLSISQYLADILGEKGCTVFLTRNRDVTLPLDERTSYTNSCYADCFISIHANAALNRNAQGIETFCLPNNKFKECFSTLSFPEKAVAIQKTSLRSQYSHALAQSIQHSLCATIAQAYNPPVDRKVKNELFQVLLGSQIPAILVEVGFLSHNIEADMLNSEQYQKTIAHGIATGIMSVFSSLVI